MAVLHSLSPCKTPSKKFSQNPNPNSKPATPFSVSLRLELPAVSLTLSGGRRLSPFLVRCSSGGHGDFEHERIVRPRPQEIAWSKDLANTVHLIGIVGAPIQIKHLSTGKVVAWTRLGVKKSPAETTWISLTLWDELAHVAFQHVEKGQQVYVCGRLVSDVLKGEDDKQQVYYKVVVQRLNFIERSLPTVSLYEPETNSVASGAKFANNVGKSSESVEELWQAFFANPVDWWDNRKNKRNPRSPDFKHKHTGEALWIDAKTNPPWVKSQLALLDSKLGSPHANGTSSAVSFMYGDDLAPF